MLSEKHDGNFILYWLNEWQKAINTVYVPTEVVTDMSAALQNAVCYSFNDGMSYQDYLESCFKCLRDNDLSILPKCWLRIDIAHLIAAVTRWKCFKNKHRRYKDFYCRCIGYISTLEDLQQVTK